MKLEIPEEIKDAKEMYDVIHQVAVGLLTWIKEQHGQSGIKKLGLNANAGCLTMDLLEKVVTRIPSEYVDVEFARGHARLFSSGTYLIKKAIPSSVVVDSLRVAGVLR